MTPAIRRAVAKFKSNLRQKGGRKHEDSALLTLGQRTCESSAYGLAHPSGCAYRSCFNDDFAETLVCPQQTPSVGDRGPFPKGHFRASGSRRRVRRTQPAGGEKTYFSPRPHSDQSVLRSFNPHSGLI